MLKLERMGEKSAEKVLKECDGSRSQPLPRVLNGLGIPFVDERTGRAAAETFGSMMRLRRPTRYAAVRAGGGPKVSDSDPAVLSRAPQSRTDRALPGGGLQI